MASIQKVKFNPTSSPEFRGLMSFGKPELNYFNNSVYQHVPARFVSSVKSQLSSLNSRESRSKRLKEISLFSFDDSVFLTMDDSELVALSKRSADHYQYSLANIESLYNFYLFNKRDGYYKKPLNPSYKVSTPWYSAYVQYNVLLKSKGLFLLPVLTKKNQNEKGYKSACLRLRTNKFWRKNYRVTQARQLEKERILLGFVSRSTKQLYVSNESLNSFVSKRKRNRDLLESMEAINEDGYSRTLQQLSDVSVSNPKIKRDELMTRLRGLEEYADLSGMVGEFYTITAPSSFHRFSSYDAGTVRNFYPNPKFSNVTPRETQAYLNGQWQKVRAELKRQELNIIGLRVSEPHHDGTPHWHMLFFINESERAAIRKVFEHYALEHDADELKDKSIRFKAISISKFNDKGRPQSAVGYIAKYISKNLSFESTEQSKDLDSDFKNHGSPVEQSINRVAAWASLWGIRQFQQIGGERITVWRELRKLRGKNAEGLPASFSDHHKAADKGDYCSFLLASESSKRIEIIRKFSHLLEHFDASIHSPFSIHSPGPLSDSLGISKRGCNHAFSNQFDELVTAPVIGLKLGSDTLITRLNVWNVEPRKKSVLNVDPFEMLVARSAFISKLKAKFRSSRSIYRNSRLFFVAARRPWTSVNNCTIQKIALSKPKKLFLSRFLSQLENLTIQIYKSDLLKQ